jgi:hypothetical protein
MPSGDVVYTTIGFVGTCAENGSTFQLYLDDEKTGAKTYHIYFKQLGGGNLTLTTGKTGANNLVMPSGTYVAIIYVDDLGNVTMAGATATSVIEAGNNLPATSEGVYQAIQSSALTVVDVVQSDNMNPVTSNAVATALSYSTSEQFTGAYWIDGKPIYRKVVNFGTLPNAVEKSVSSGITNLDTVVDIRGKTDNGVDLLPIPYANSSTVAYSIQLWYGLAENKIKIKTGTNRTSYTNTKIVVEYTKTTDTATRSIPTENTRKVEEETKDDEPIEEPKEEEKK